MRSAPPPPRSNISGSWRAVAPDKVPAVVSELLDRTDKTEDWKGRKSQQLAVLESRVDVLEEKLRAHEQRRQDDRLWLEREFAAIKQTIAVAEAKVRSVMLTIGAIWSIVVVLLGLLLKFLG